ncbi:MAG: thiamine phosphate synthase [Sulfuriflexus sp.]|nr:thiamine phosphate synthase [Sulfuriflexus sp.]
MTKSQHKLNGLYVITDDKLSGNAVLKHVQQALEGGARLVQYRNKTKQAAIKEMTARSLLELCREHGVPLLINDDVELAIKINADGVHLGQTDTRLTEARNRLGNDAIIGVTCHASLELAKQAEKNGASYVAFGRFFASQTKPDASPASIDLLTLATQQLSIPICAIGGITPDNASALLDAGADMLAVIHGVFGESDIKNAAKHYAQLCI